MSNTWITILVLLFIIISFIMLPVIPTYLHTVQTQHTGINTI